MRLALALTLLLTVCAMTGSGQLLGGFKRHSDHHNDAHVQEVAKFAAQQVSEKAGKSLDLVKVVSVDTQVVAGKNYKLVLDLATPEQRVEQWQALVYEPLGDAALQLSSHERIGRGEAEMAHEASSERASGALLGSAVGVSAEDGEVQAAARFAAEQLSQQSNSLLPLKLHKVLQATQSVADGKVWQLKLELAQGDAPAKVFDVTVSQSLAANSLKLDKVGGA